MKLQSALVIVSVLCLACEKVVDIKDLTPKEVVSCSLDQDIEGMWISDSVHIVSVIDTVDSVSEDKSPTLTYYLNVKCDEEKAFRLSYITFAGVETEDVRSTNYEALNNRFYVYNQLDSIRDTAAAPFVLDYYFADSNRITASMVQLPNAFQRTAYTIFFRRSL